MPQNRRARTVAEKDTRVAIGPIRDRTELLRADDEHRFVSMRSDELLRDLDCEKKTCARRRDVETSCLCRSNLCLHQTSRRRKQHVGGGGCEKDEIDFFGRNPCLLDRGQCGFRRHVARAFILRGDAALFNAGAGRNPLVGRVDHPREIGVGQNFFRRVAAGADDRNGAPRFTGARARAGLSFHDTGGLPRRYAGSPAVQSIRRRRARRS